MKILVTGASGFLGKKAMEIFKKNYVVVGTALSRVYGGLIRMDITNPEEVKRIVNHLKPDVIFHAAAIVDVDLCEEDKAKAWDVNVNSPFYLAELCKQKNIKLVVISSDYIYSGENSPYKEDSIPHPKSFYGFTKLIMEQTVSYINPDALILRIPILYGYNGPGEEDKLIIPVLKFLKKDKDIVIEDYRKKYPILVDDVVKNALILINRNEKGIFNFTTKKPLDKFEIATIIAKVFGLDEKLVKKGKAKEFPLKPRDVRLINTRDKSLRFVSFKEGVKIVKRQMGSKART